VRRAYWQTAAAQRVKQVAGISDIDQAIAKIAEGLVDGLAGPPTDLEALANRVDVTDIRRDDTMLVPGELRDLQGQLVVFLLPNLPKTRRRFTIAHELGHAFFERMGRRPRPSRELERLCDKFAAEFLMPRRIFLSHAGRNPDLGHVRQLCQTFETGLLSTLGRVSDIYRYGAIELRDEEVVWSRRLSVEVRHQVSARIRSSSGQFGADVVDIYERGGYSRWNLQWEALGDEDHSVGLLRPA